MEKSLHSSASRGALPSIGTKEYRDYYADVMKRGEAIYQRVKEELEGRYRGQYVAINVLDGRYAIASRELDAIDQAKKMCGESFGGYLRGVGFVEFFGNV